MENNTLENRLRSLGMLDIRYNRLWEVYSYNKPLICKKLDNVKWFFFQYSKHDASHSEKIIIAIERFLGNHGIEYLSATDIYLLLLSCYLHDYSMALNYEEVEKLITSVEFTNFIKELEESGNFVSDVKNIKGEYVKSTDILPKEKIMITKNNSDDNLWTLEVTKSIYRLVAEYYRRSHGTNSAQIILDRFNRDEININPDSVFPDRLEKLIASIVELHQMDFNEIFKLLKVESGIYDDEIHPRFLAFLLRIGDLLDADSNRYDEVQVHDLFPFNHDSNVHYHKHHSVTNYYVSPTQIIIKAQNSNEEVVRAMRNWCDYISNEINNYQKNMNEMIPEEWKLRVPKCELKTIKNESVSFYKDKNINMEISSEKAFDLITGSSIYQTPLAFLREYIQNCVDATKIKLWCYIKEFNDIKSDCISYEVFKIQRQIIQGEYKRLFDSMKITIYIYDLKDLTEDKIDMYTEKILNGRNYTKGTTIYDLRNFIKKLDIDYTSKYDTEKLYSKIKNCLNECIHKIILIFEDYGIGISNEIITKRILKPANHQECKLYTELVKNIPPMLRPTGTFGIGLHSAFMVSDKVVFHTKYLYEPNLITELSIHSTRNKGWVEYSKLDNSEVILKSSGTKAFIYCNPEKIEIKLSDLKVNISENERYINLIEQYIKNAYRNEFILLKTESYVIKGDTNE